MAYDVQSLYDISQDRLSYKAQTQTWDRFLGIQHIRHKIEAFAAPQGYVPTHTWRVTCAPLLFVQHTLRS